MGNWNMTVVGVGCHHNHSNPTDADKMFAEFVEKLKEAGHSLSHASITFGGAQIEVKSSQEITPHVHFIDGTGNHHHALVVKFHRHLEGPDYADLVIRTDARYTGTTQVSDASFTPLNNVPYAHPSKGTPHSWHYPHDRK